MDPAARSVDDLWAAYRSTRSVEARNALVVQYSPLVKYVVGRVRSGLPAAVESDDLVSEGVVGLMDAIDKFDDSRGLQFQTYAVPRIRGAIMDSLRAADWVPRSVRTRLREVDRARETLRERLGREPDDAELAAETGFALAEVREARERPTAVVHDGEEEMAALRDPRPPLEEAFDDEGTRRLLLKAVRRLSERDQVVVALYFFEGFTLAEIGQVLGVTESRVSQLRSRATAKLRTALAESI